MSDAIRQDVISLYHRGIPPREIAAMLHIRSEAINRIIAGLDPVRCEPQWSDDASLRMPADINRS